MEAEIVKPTDEPAGEFGLVASIEVIGAEVAVRYLITQDVAGRGEHRRATATMAFFGPPRLLSRRNRAQR